VNDHRLNPKEGLRSSSRRIRGKPSGSGGTGLLLAVMSKIARIFSGWVDWFIVLEDQAGLIVEMDMVNFIGI